MESLFLAALNGLSYGMLLFMLSAGLTVIFSMMGVLNFAHASFYMAGAYLASTLANIWGFAWALVWAPLCVGLLGMAFERYGLRRVSRQGHVAELLLTFGLSFLLLEMVQLVWGRGSVSYLIPETLQGSLFTFYDMPFSRYRAFIMAMATVVLLLLWLALVRTRIGLILQAALTHAKAVQALGHNVPRIFTGVFAGGAALAGLAGVLGGNLFVTEPGMAATIGSVLFVVVVVGGLGSLMGAFVASLVLGLVQTLCLEIALIRPWAPVLPFLLMVLMLSLRAQGLMGQRGA
jgi:branched-chain amino acid transport system permease protein